MSQRSQKLLVCYDPGTSLSKILYRMDSESVRYLTMQPETVALPAASVSTLPSSLGSGKPEDNAWVRLNSEGECFAVGRMARDYRASVSLKRLKYESLIPKILAALGAIAVKENTSKRLSLDLALLIPFGEYANRDSLEVELRQALEGFYFRERSFNIRLKRYECVAEAGGIVFSTIRRDGLECFQNQTLAYLMFGYRNTSLLLFRNGTLCRNESSTTQLGFYDFIDKVAAKVSGLSRDEIQGAIATLREGYHNREQARRDYRQATRIVVEDLVKSTDPSKADREKRDLEEAIETATAEYWQILTHWLHERLPPLRQLDGAICCGGASELLQERISSYFEGKIAHWQTDWEEKQLLTALQLDEYQKAEFEKQNLALRFADVWGLFAHFSGYEVESGDRVA